MKRNNVLRISILPLIIFALMTFTNIQPQKDDKKNNKGQPTEKGKSQEQKGNDNHSQGNNKHEGDDDQWKEKKDKDNNHDREDRSDVPGNSDKMKDNAKMNKNKGNRKSETMHSWRNASVNWDMNNFANRKSPKRQKKVTICHHPGEDSYPVSLNISENAVEAHMNHGDQIGNCNINYSDRWSSNYITSRENVYNTYENTWETMSYSEALLKYAVEKLLGVRTNLDRNRRSFTSQEVQRREVLILDLQNNVNALENQLGLTRQNMDSNVNIIIQL